MTANVQVRRPAEGWLTLGLVLALGLIVAWAMDDPAWVNGRGALTDCLGTFALFGVLVGFAGPKLGWGRWTTHLIGALFAAILIPVIAGWTAYPGASLGQAFHEVAYRSVDAYLDLAWRGMRLTDQEIHYTVVMGWIVWGTSQFASYAVFGHRRPLAAIVVLGMVLIVNMGLTTRNQLSYIIAFTAGSLFLLIQMHAFDERATWIRRRIGDPSTISSLYLRGGTIFIAGAMVVSMLLTTRATSAPLAGAWVGINDQLVDLGEQLSRYLPVGGAVKPLGPLSFGDTARISTRWFSDDRIAFTATVPKGYAERWRAATYDTYAFTGWAQSLDGITALPVPAGSPVLANTAENPDKDPDSNLTTDVAVTVTPDQYNESRVVVPGAPVTVDRDTSALVFGDLGWFVGVGLPGGSSGTYSATGAVPVIDTAKGAKAEDGITQEKLRAAGTGYPQEVVDLYTDVPDGTLGPNAQALLDDILATTTSRNPYDLAATMEKYLRSDRFTYDIDITDIPCPANAVECFATIKRGYCLHFASTMAMLLRAVPGQHIPTRLVQGFLPGDVQGTTTTVKFKDAHAWVEVYFPGYGWIPFDPTRDVGHPSGPTIPVGVPQPSHSLLPLPSRDPNDRDQEGPSFRAGPPLGGGGTPPSGPANRGLLIVFAVVLAAAVIGIAFLAWLRGPRGEMSPDNAWKAMSRTASRFGYGPRPTQTVYEYAAVLGEVVPAAERDIGVVAMAKVETSYAGAKLAGARMDAVRDATRRLRITLLRLAFRRPRRRRRGPVAR